MLLTRGCQYGIQALLYLHAEGAGAYVSVRRIADAHGLSPSFLSKITSRLVGARLLDSLKGPGGGIRLGRSAEDITLLDVVEAIDGLESLSECVLGFAECSDRAACAVHEEWDPLREAIVAMLSARNLNDLARKRRRVPARRKGARKMRR